MSQPYRIALATAIACCTLFAASFLTSCSRDCKDTTCLNGGICKDGKCKCPDGYEGAGCEIDRGLRFSGSWEGRRCSNSNTFHYTERIEIKPSDSAGHLEIVFDGHHPVYGRLAGDSVFIDRQSHSSMAVGGPFTYIQGTMAVVVDTLIYHYNYQSSFYGQQPNFEECGGRYMRD